MTHRGLAAVTAVVAVTIASGCGGGSDGGDPSDNSGGDSTTAASSTFTYPVPGLTKQELVAHVNSLCRRKWRFILHAFREYRGDLQSIEPELDDRQRYAKAAQLAYLPSINFHIYDHVRDLGAPPGDVAEVEAVIGTAQEAIMRGQRMRPATHRAQFRTLFAEYNQAARAYGLDECLASWRHLPHGEP